ncbi:ABC transporter substrate-binding protein [Saccharolobus caldissimus]|uniref:Peptide ABC transporter substrate-binding protein n=1 Tax=Saccharolobus caldissimus TaxID=1702097 RepID=A0AAQ4CV59_9CREN|nr:ABC transporter substrate-binding protein [Saccharolobus caldissimus]BDB99690.1 peptide ABC transporter substrate-binding protein [Saccharolobus caldissimus]
MTLNYKSTFLSLFLTFLIIFSISAIIYNNLITFSQSNDQVLYLGIVRLATLPSLNILSPVNAYPIIAELYLRFVYTNYPPSPLVQKQLGQSWSHNSNYTVWILTLKPNLKWDNGEPLNATDLWYTLYLYQHLEHEPPFEYIENVSIINSTSVRVILNQSDPNFIIQLAITNSLILPYQVYSKIPLNQVQAYKNFNNIIADGPFVIYNYTPGENPIIFQANPYFYEGPPKMKELVLYLYSSESAYISALEAGKLDALWASGGYSIVKPLSTLPGFSIYRITPSGYEIVTFNVYSYPFNLTKFRQALAYATNRSYIAEKVFGPNYTLMDYDTLLPSINAEGYGPISMPEYNYNLTEVNVLMESLGFKKVNGVWEYPNGTPITINIIVPSDEPDSESVAILLSNMWKQAGFTTSVIPMTEATVYSSIQTGKYQVAVYTDFGATAPAPWFDFYPQQPGNYYASPSLPPFNRTYGTLLSKIQSLPFTSNAAKNISKQIALIVAEQVPVIPLYVTYNWVVISNKFYWGNPSNYTGIFSNEVPVQMQLWTDTLYIVHPVISTITTISTTSVVKPITNDALLVASIIVVVIVIAVMVIIFRRRR